jgi:hypothetical protein
MGDSRLVRTWREDSPTISRIRNKEKKETKKIARGIFRSLVPLLGTVGSLSDCGILCAQLLDKHASPSPGTSAVTPANSTTFSLSLSLSLSGLLVTALFFFFFIFFCKFKPAHARTYTLLYEIIIGTVVEPRLN